MHARAESVQLPVNPHDFCGHGSSGDVPDLDAFNDTVEDLRRKLGYIAVLRQGRLNPSPFHAFGKGSHLSQHIRIEHAVIDRVRFGAGFRVVVVLHAAVQILLAVGQLPVRNGKPVPAAIAIQQPAEDVFSVAARGARVALFCEPGRVELLLGDDRLVRVDGHNSPFRRRRDALLGLVIHRLGFQCCQPAQINGIV